MKKKREFRVTKGKQTRKMMEVEMKQYIKIIRYCPAAGDGVLLYISIYIYIYDLFMKF